jgi:hypothetical protein
MPDYCAVYLHDSTMKWQAWALPRQSRSTICVNNWIALGLNYRLLASDQRTYHAHSHHAHGERASQKQGADLPRRARAHSQLKGAASSNARWLNGDNCW